MAFEPTLHLPLGGGRLSERYELCAALVHHGASLHSGHYTAIGKDPNGDWYLFDDQVVQPASVTDVLKAPAYILFYEKRRETERAMPFTLAVLDQRLTRAQGTKSLCWLLFFLSFENA